MTKKAVRATVSNTKAAVGLHKSGLDEDGAAPEHLRYAEFVHLMRTGVLNTRFPGHDWRSGAKQLHNYRKAFDTADVDGDDTLEQGEFEMVMDTLHLGHDLTPGEVRHCWEVTSNGAHWLPNQVDQEQDVSW